MKAVVFEPTPARMLLALAYARLTNLPATFAAGPLSYRDLPPTSLPGSRHVRVRCRFAGVCGTDLSLLRVKFSMRSATMARPRLLTRAACLGHEAMGEVIETGDQVDSVKVGDRVVLVPGIFCAALEKNPFCAMCAQGYPLLCLHRDENPLELAHGGGWSGEFVRHQSQLFPVPEGVTDEQAALVEPISCGVHAVLRKPPEAGDHVIVIGCGTIGLAIIMALRALGVPVKILVIARYQSQILLAERLGADRVFKWDPPTIYHQLAREIGTEVWARGAGNKLLRCGAARVYDAVGSGETLYHALRWVRPRGAVILEGVRPAPGPRDCTPLWLREVDLLGCHGHGIENLNGRRVHSFQISMEWIAQKKINPERLVTHRFGLREFKDALRVAADKRNSGAIKTLLDPTDA